MAITLELSRPDPSEEFSRADLEFRGVDHSGPSYEACIFFDNPRADASTPREEAEGYAGSFHIFGHGGCFGELGHCDVGEAPRGVYDRRQPHPLTPYFKTVIVTDALRRLQQTGKGETFTVTVVADVPENQVSRVKVDDPLKFESVSLISYQDASAAGILMPQEPMAP
jgi:tyrosinase